MSTPSLSSLPTWPPVFGICGRSGSGKTQLMECLVRRFAGDGLAVGYVKHCGHRVTGEAEAKDTERLFKAGARVVGHDDEEAIVRRRDAGTLPRAVTLLGRSLDIVLVEGHKTCAHPKLWLLSPGESAQPGHVPNVIAALPPGASRLEDAAAIVQSWLREEHRALPLAVGILASARGGGGPAAVADGIEVAQNIGAQVVLLGGKQEPGDSISRLPDVPGASGPLAGIVAAFRWEPDRRWLILSGGMPQLNEHALRALIDGARPGRWAVLAERGQVDCFAGLFDPPMGPLFEEALLRPDPSPWFAIEQAKAHVVDGSGCS